jgi:UPF0176 protein
MYFVLSLYKFFYIKDIALFRETLLNHLKPTKIKGTILIAQEGVNGVMSGKEEEIIEFKKFLQYLIENEEKNNTDLKEAQDAFKTEFISKLDKYNNIPFTKLKLRLKKEIVTMKVENLTTKAGKYIEPKNWSSFIESKKEKKMIFIDTRNDYEYEMGTFKGAINPKNNVFSEFPSWANENLSNLDKNTIIVGFCTGGVRCEKSSRYLRGMGFDEVYHLKGGILEYLQETENKDNEWQGECFVFDDRFAVNSVSKIDI